ncbi:MAG: potassium-transporting ATPase subunit KdpA [Chloroflexi bacterium]|nr:potassium-transporting ATPase subunit KdpA [Chloroflexota bacterium]
MTPSGFIQIGLYLVVLALLVKPLGSYMARVYEGQSTPLDRVLGPVERLSYRLFGIRPEEEMDWKIYTVAVLLFSVIGAVTLYALQRLQGMLPLNPQGLGAVSSDSSFNTAISFTTNTNWQGYSGEVTMSYLTQMVGLTFHNFVSAAAGMAVLVALIRGLVRRNAQTIGNFWVDLTRTTLYILLPMSFVLALILVSQGMVQTLSPYQTVSIVQPIQYDQPKLDANGSPIKDANGKIVTESITLTEQVIAVGPTASQIAIKQLGTNGGGFFNTNSAHPFENPTPLTNFLESLSILLIAGALCYTFGKMVGDTRQGWALLAAMFFIVIIGIFVAYSSEAAGNPRIAVLGVNQIASDTSPGGNMEGKEVRFGVANSALWATVTTAASNGSVNSMHDSYTPLGGLVSLVMMQLGEVIFGGVGSGLYGMLIFLIIAVFVAGLMVGRTPEYLGKKIEAYEMKMASIGILIMPLVVLLLTAIAVVNQDGLASIWNPGAHGFSEILYAFTSQGNNNGSAFAGLSANTPFYNTAGGIAMLFGRFWIKIPVLAIAGALARKKKIPVSAGTLPTHTPLFVGWLLAVVLIVGALVFFPADSLGPIVEHLHLIAP